MYENKLKSQNWWEKQKKKKNGIQIELLVEGKMAQPMRAESDERNV
jgi:hypothetical protein